MTSVQRFLKRSFDIGVSFVGVAACLVPGAVVALIIKVSSPGPVFFVQTRVGRHGRRFRCVKLRTMYPAGEAGGSVTIAGDPRITAVGRFLRKHTLDELPQLWNVLLGHMSLVGPRPDVPGYADQLQGDARRLLELRPGITGPASIYFRDEDQLLASVGNPREYNDTVIWPKKVQLNLEYLDNWRLWRDIGYMLRTVGSKRQQL